MMNEELRELKADVKELLVQVHIGNEARIASRKDLDYLMTSFDKHMEEEPAAWTAMHERLSHIDKGLQAQIVAIDNRIGLLENTKQYVEAYAKGATKGTTIAIGGAVTIIITTVAVLVYKFTGIDLGAAP